MSVLGVDVVLHSPCILASHQQQLVMYSNVRNDKARRWTIQPRNTSSYGCASYHTCTSTIGRKPARIFLFSAIATAPSPYTCVIPIEMPVTTPRQNSLDTFPFFALWKVSVRTFDRWNPTRFLRSHKLWNKLRSLTMSLIAAMRCVCVEWKTKNSRFRWRREFEKREISTFSYPIRPFANGAKLLNYTATPSTRRNCRKFRPSETCSSR